MVYYGVASGLTRGIALQLNLKWASVLNFLFKIFNSSSLSFKITPYKNITQDITFTWDKSRF